MRVHSDCLACNLRQIVEACELCGCDNEVEKEILKDSLKVLENFDKYDTPPELGRAMQKIVNEKAKNDDAYKSDKVRDMKLAKELLPTLKNLVNKKEDKLYWSLKAAAVGNVLDSGVARQRNLDESLREEFEKEFTISDYKQFKDRLSGAKKILVISDNCGETVFDTIMLDMFPKQAEIIYATRNIPIINDATVQDAIDSGVDKYAKIISSGSNYPGTVLRKCSNEFLDIFNDADIVISKGQGNFETMSECGREIFYILKAKCPVVADSLNVETGSYILKMI